MELMISKLKKYLISLIRINDIRNPIEWDIKNVIDDNKIEYLISFMEIDDISKPT